MTVYRKESLLMHHAFLRLRLLHAAFVDSYEYQGQGNNMSVNRLLFVCGNGSGSTIRDLSDGSLFQLCADHLYFIPCNHMIDICIMPGLPFVSLQFNLDLFYGCDLFATHPHCEVLEAPQLVTEARLLMEHATELTTVFRVNEIIFHLCGCWCQVDSSDIHERLLKSQRYQQVLEFIQNAGDAATTVEMLADMSGMRKDVFSRIFTRDIGITPKAFVSHSLVRKASELLLSPDISVSEAAERLNFSSEFYFSHFFKRHTGIAPSVYKKQNLSLAPTSI